MRGKGKDDRGTLGSASLKIDTPCFDHWQASTIVNIGYNSLTPANDDQDQLDLAEVERILLSTTDWTLGKMEHMKAGNSELSDEKRGSTSIL